MRKFVVPILSSTCLSLTVLAAPAWAADILVEETQVVETAPVLPAPDWTGAFIGVIGGYGWGDFDVDSRGAEAPGGEEIEYDDFSVDADGAFLGVQAGYHHQIGSFVLGVVGDISWTGIDGEDGIEVNFGEAPEPPPAAAASEIDADDNFAVAAELDWLGTIRGKAGFAVGNLMLYGTAGLAFGQTEAVIGYTDSGEYPPPTDTVTLAASLPDRFEYQDSFEDVRVGYAVGAGAAAMVTPNIMVELGYLFVDLGEEEYEIEDEEDEVIIGSGEIDFSAHLLRAGLSFKF